MKLCNLDTSKALQELGYDGYYNYIYAKNTESSLRYIGFKEVFELSEYTGPPAPRLDDAAYWIRDEYHLSIRLNYGRGFGWFADILNLITGEYIDCNFKPTYDDALEAAVTKAIEIIKNKKQ